MPKLTRRQLQEALIDNFLGSQGESWLSPKLVARKFAIDIVTFSKKKLVSQREESVSIFCASKNLYMVSIRPLYTFYFEFLCGRSSCLLSMWLQLFELESVWPSKKFTNLFRDWWIANKILLFSFPYYNSLFS